MLGSHRFALASSLLATVLIGSIHAQKGAKPGGGGNTLFPVTADFRCPLGADCFTPDQIEGDTLGLYRARRLRAAPRRRRVRLPTWAAT